VVTRKRPVYDPWTRVDQLADPGRMARMLEDRAVHPDQVDMRRRFWEWLGVPSGTAALEVGCGTGVWARELAWMVGESGRVFGVDPSRFFIEEARRLARERGAPPNLAVGVASGAALPFREGTWDLVLVATVFTHVRDHVGLMRELARVVRRGGRLAVFDQDLETFVVNHSDRNLTRRISNVHCDAREEGWSGRRILGLMRQAGLGGTRCLPLAWVDVDCGPYMRHTLNERAAFAVEQGAVSEAEARAWLDELEGRAGDGTFFSGLTYYGFVGSK
jgi:SAM-dependent methyltransferase